MNADPAPAADEAPASDQAPAADRLDPADLRDLFLFESLTGDQLAEISRLGRVRHWPPGADVYAEGDPAECFFVLLDGAIALTRRVRGADVEVTRSDQRGAYAGATQAYAGERMEQVYPNTMRALTDVALLALPAPEFAAVIRQWFPMAMHLLDGLFVAMRTTQTVVGERERLVALGSLTAGLTHELNNPAAAAVRATAVLRERLAGMRQKLAMVADGRLDGAQLHRLVELQETAVRRATTAPLRTPLQVTDAEDALADWLDAHGVPDGWELAATLVAGGFDDDALDEVAGAVLASDLTAAVRWLAYTVETELLLGEIDDAVRRISSLVGAAKQYSQLDRAPHQTVDVHELLDATLAMFTGKIPAEVRVVRDYDRTLPAVPAYPAELNQVWTNLIDNALGAMGPAGTLTVRTGTTGDQLSVEITDTGPGIPPEVRPRIFEPFFTTKPIGEGTGLGLDISYRIVVKKHGGDIRVDSAPGATSFRVLLPLTAG
ncbi:ATP-binding protein [Solwaraspora sp. WMMA2056]|uniref:sensor histidine kinase n=1 Tax=Solwaraspora sp. WMMA2056 TaxID=3015161 RepID=UPI00259B515D|nr:ATP-binding protein [Solwaraspora sp. WMMA2056]WJK41286.1 ATP-binding protein [Solwaraspora sp. WMMA2056]